MFLDDVTWAVVSDKRVDDAYLDLSRKVLAEAWETHGTMPLSDVAASLGLCLRGLADGSGHHCEWCQYTDALVVAAGEESPDAWGLSQEVGGLSKGFDGMGRDIAGVEDVDGWPVGSIAAVGGSRFHREATGLWRPLPGASWPTVWALHSATLWAVGGVSRSS